MTGPLTPALRNPSILVRDAKAAPAGEAALPGPTVEALEPRKTPVGYFSPPRKPSAAGTSPFGVAAGGRLQRDWPALLAVTNGLPMKRAVAAENPTNGGRVRPTPTFRPPSGTPSPSAPTHRGVAGGGDVNGPTGRPDLAVPTAPPRRARVSVTAEH